MKIALVQTFIFWGNKQKNIDYAEKVIKHYRREGIEMFIFPELSFTGFTADVEKYKESENQTIRQIQLMAAKYKTVIGIGWIKDCITVCENHYSIISPSGMLADYTKIHPFSYGNENLYYRGGKNIVTCEYKGFKLGLQICYDLRFPDVFLKAAEDVDLMIVPANWPAKRVSHWSNLLKARAIENQIYVAGVNCAGNFGGQYYSGDSCIINPDGNACFGKEVRISNECSEAKILIYDIENDVEQFRESFPVRRDRVNLENEE